VIDLSGVNFDNGIAGKFGVDIMQHMVRKTMITENLNKRYESGKIKRKNIDKARRLTGGTIWDANNVLLDEEILRLREEKEIEKETEKKELLLRLLRTITKGRNVTMI